MAKTRFMDTNIGKTIKATGYIAASAALAFLITETAGEPALFGPVTPLINVLLVFLKKTFFEAKTENLGGI